MYITCIYKILHQRNHTQTLSQSTSVSVSVTQRNSSLLMCNFNDLKIVVFFLPTILFSCVLSSADVLICSALLCLQYLEFCDEVLLLDNGEIKEAGTHSDLMKAKGHYTHLINNVQMEQSNVTNLIYFTHEMSH